MASTTLLPELPVRHADLVKHITNNPKTPLVELIKPFREYEARLRQAYAQNPDAEVLKDPFVNVLPLFTEDVTNVKVRARDLANESKAEKSRYIMTLPKVIRRPNDSPAVVQSVKEFQRNFNVFSESSLVDLNWDNIVAAGSSVVNCLLPVPEEHNTNKRGLREFYHEKFCPASDVDLFLYGLTEEQAIEKIKEVESSVRDALLTETTTVRTKHAITICSQYPTRHIQIVLRIYKSVSEILTGFDIDCSGAAYDGKQVYCTPRALESYMTQINHIDLSRRSPSYENRLSKYSHRGFEVYWPDLDRSRIDPTIFERSFQRTLGLARLLVLERLPTSTARDRYLDQRRVERGRPSINRYYRRFRSLHGNIKEAYEDEVADWVDSEEVSNYHTFTIPYGEKFHAKKIEKLCYTRDLLLNAEWNQPEDRPVYLHRHPAFFGRVKDVINDCCGYCPPIETEEEKEIAEQEDKIYVSGKISFIKDDPGRQQIGSFNPLTEDDWTEMAYVGNTTRLCQAIVDCDAEHVEDWLAQEGADPNTRDYTGRTPLHLAVMNSTPEVVQLLVNAGARLVSRLADGRTALHIAAARGNAQIVKILMDKSVANEAEFEDKKDQRRLAKASAATTPEKADEADEMDVNEDHEEDEDESDGEMIDGESDDDGEGHSIATGSFVKVKSRKENPPQDDILPDEDEEEPDFYDVNIISWDDPCSALHFAIIEGHEEIVKTLCQDYGADILLPVKFLDEEKKPRAAVLTLVLALTLPLEKAKSMVKLILSLGAMSAQADLNGITAFHRYVEANAASLIQVLWEEDPTGAKSAVNHTAFFKYGDSMAPLQTAIEKRNLGLVVQLLEQGGSPDIDFEKWLKLAKQSVIKDHLRTIDDSKREFGVKVKQPLIMAIRSPIPEAAIELLERGANPNPLTGSTIQSLHNQWVTSWTGETALDVLRQQLKELREYKGERVYAPKPDFPEGLDTYLSTFKEGTFWHAAVLDDVVRHRRTSYCDRMKTYRNEVERNGKTPGASEKEAVIKRAIESLEKLEQVLVSKGGKTFKDLHPERKEDGNSEASPRRNYDHWSRSVSRTPYEYNFFFTGANDSTGVRKGAYIELFEAAWDGDIKKIKKLTLTSWDEAQEEPPLEIAVKDQKNWTPFGVAFMRGHFDVAKAVLEIAQAQYTPAEKPRARYRMAADHDSEYSDDERSEASDDDSEPRLHTEVVDTAFTIENVGYVSKQVKSHTTALEFLEWDIRILEDDKDGAIWTRTRPLHYAIRRKDLKAFKFLLDMGEHYTALKSSELGGASSFYSPPDDVFRLAISSGQVEMLVELIKRTGGGIPLEDMVSDSGIELKETPLFYQGLTVYGKKRKDWATAGREVVDKQTGIKTSPLLLAAKAGNLESVEWFLTDIPLRHYLEFSKTKGAREDARLKHLTQSPGGFEGAISKWLKDQSDTVIHAALLHNDTEETKALVSFLVNARPTLINARASNGATPLMVACRLGRVECVKILLEAGADQSIKDSLWNNNLLHSALRHNPRADQLKSLVDLLDRGLVVQMMTERNNLGDEGRTPLHSWLAALTRYHAYRGTDYTTDIDQAVQVLKYLIELLPEETAKRVLHTLDGSGDTVLHTLISMDEVINYKLLEVVLTVDPDLLFRENAVGRTALEVAHDLFFGSKVKEPSRNHYYRHHLNHLMAASPSTFIEKGGNNELEDVDSRAAIFWKLCSEFAETRATTKKRKLVSLHEANDVAKRLGKGFMGDRYKFQLRSKDKKLLSDSESLGSKDEEEEEEEEEKPAAVTEQKKRAKNGGEDFVSENYNADLDSWGAFRKLKKDIEEKEKSGICDGCLEKHAKNSITRGSSE